MHPAILTFSLSVAFVLGPDRSAIAVGRIAIPAQQNLSGARLELALFGLGFEKHGGSIHAEGTGSSKRHSEGLTK